MTGDRVAVYEHGDGGLALESSFIPAEAIRKLSIDPESGLVSIQFFGRPWPAEAEGITVERVETELGGVVLSVVDEEE